MSERTVRADAMRRTETPNAVMTTVASPTQGATGELSVWRVVMRAGQEGPRHVFDREQVWHVLDGEIDITVDGDSRRLATGDAVVLPGAAERQVRAVTDTTVVACGYGDAVVTAVGEDRPRGVPPWIG